MDDDDHDGYQEEVTDVEETSGGEWEDPGSADLHRVDRVQGEGGQGSQHAHTRRPDLSLSSLPPGEAALEQYRKVAHLVRDLVDQDGEGGDYSHFKRGQKTKNVLHKDNFSNDAFRMCFNDIEHSIL